MCKGGCNHMLEVGRNVIKCELLALEKLQESLDENFSKAVDLIINHTNQDSAARLIVSGMGKSGHIAAKLAATFASTGQPSFFVHPAESGHGDLGMISKHDILLLLSYSGETKELQSLCDYAKRRSVPIISITSGKSSSLANLSDTTLLLPKAKEACPMGLAPTSSSTMTLALGDALAIALLTKRGFTKDDFHAFHPSGSLGQQLKRVDSIMHENIPLVEEKTLMPDAIRAMTDYGFGCVGVVDNNQKLIGIITDGDIRRHALNEVFNKRLAREVMSHNPHTIPPNSLLVEVIKLCETKSISVLFVVDENHKPVGVVHFLDCLRNQVA